ncbi:response regulator transcription factor [bacterium]|nr:response regulator transcription factor [bacterium]
MSIRVLLADDHKIVREGFRKLLDQEVGIEVIGEADTGRRTVELAQELAPDVIVMDITMPDLNGIDATHQIRKKVPNARVLCLSMHSDKRFVLAVLRAGASGYLLKDCPFEELARAIYTVARNEVYLSTQIAHYVVDESITHTKDKKSAAYTVLTPREREIVQLIAEGKNTKTIAFDLGISVKTVEAHRRQIMKKLKIHSVAELTKYAINEGLTTLDT